MGTTYAYHSTIDEDAVRRRDALVLAHLPQVHLIAKRLHDRLPSYVCLDDLISTGVLGLISAIDNFDPSLNVQLKTYADRKIHGAILESLRELDWAPREVRKKWKLIEKAIHRAQQIFGREPSEEEIAAELSLSVAEYQRWLNEVQAVDLKCLEQAPADGSGRDLLAIISDDEDQLPSRIVERSELQRILALAIERMPKVERTVLSLYYYEDLNLRQIAEIMGVHLSRVGQLRAMGVLRLRAHLERVWMSAPRKKV